MKKEHRKKNEEGDGRNEIESIGGRSACTRKGRGLRK